MVNINPASGSNGSAELKISPSAQLSSGGLCLPGGWDWSYLRSQTIPRIPEDSLMPENTSLMPENTSLMPENTSSDPQYPGDTGRDGRGDYIVS